MTTFRIAGTLALLVLAPAAAHAADIRAPAGADTTWSGPYVGAEFGYGAATATASSTTTTASANLTGLFVGGQAGYNFRLGDNVVAGIEGDLDWNNQQGVYGTLPGASGQRIDWDGSVRSRLGLAVGAIMPYVEAGVSVAHSTVQVTYPATYTGWTAGAGVEVMLTDALSANAEYRYSDYGTQIFGGTTPIALTNNTFRTGLNYHF